MYDRPNAFCHKECQDTEQPTYVLKTRLPLYKHFLTSPDYDFEKKK